MMVGRVTKVVNPHRPKKSISRARPKSAARNTHRPRQPKKRSASNPAYLLNLGWVNPRKLNPRRKAVASKARPKKKRSGHRKGAVAMNKKRNATFVVMPKQNRRKRSRNPMFFGVQVPAPKMAMLVAGGLVGVAVNRTLLPMLPASITQSNLGATAAAVAIAVAEWWAFSFIDKEFGAAAGFGGLMNAGSQALNAFVPSVGAVVGLRGVRRGTGDFVPARFTIPENPVDISAVGNGLAERSAYPAAYALAA